MRLDSKHSKRDDDGKSNESFTGVYENIVVSTLN